MNSDIHLLYKWWSQNTLYQEAPPYFTVLQLQKLLLNELSLLQDCNYNNKSLEFRGVSPVLTGRCWVTRLFWKCSGLFWSQGSGLPHLPGAPQPWHCLVWGHHHWHCLHPELWYTWEHWYSAAGKGQLGTGRFLISDFLSAAFVWGYFAVQCWPWTHWAHRFKLLAVVIEVVLFWPLLFANSIYQKSGLNLRIHHLTWLLKRS